MLRELITPKPAPYDADEWTRAPFEQRLRMVCRAWALDGYGTPVGAFGFYVLKIALYVGGWLYFCSRSPALGAPATIATWWALPVAFQKAILWSMVFEGLGLGCGSGPLTGRYMPPVAAFLHFLRPGTTKLPVFPGVPLIGGVTRSWFDAALYAALLAASVRALLAPTLDVGALVPIVVLVPLLGIVDRTVFLALRGEHYWVTLVCFVAATDFVPGAKAVQLALWFWAGASKLNHHFPYVVSTMTSNSPVIRSQSVRRAMYMSFPDDLRPSRMAVVMAHVGTGLELGVPLILAFSDGGPTLVVGLVLMVALHGFITSNVPMGVPLEWNVMVVYGAFVLFGANTSAHFWDVDPPLLAGFLIVTLVLVPLVGNLAPSRVPFLLAMRYYAGNWPFSIWLFQGQSHRKLDSLTKSAPFIYDQLDLFYDAATSRGLMTKVVGFRAMHLHGRVLTRLVDRAVPDVRDYEYLDGELVAGMVLGWNFGDGHLHNEGLMQAVQRQCGFESGELRAIFVEPQALFGRTLAYRIVDAKTGPLDEGSFDIDDLRARQPWDVG